MSFIGDYEAKTQKNFSQTSSPKPDNIFTTHQNKNDNQAENTTSKATPAAQVNKKILSYKFLVVKVKEYFL